MTAVLDAPAGSAGVVEQLTEEECYLAAILMDESGLDLMEFAFVDQERDDGCYRAYPFQWPWWRCKDERQVDHNGRSTGKTEGVTGRAGAFGFNHPGEEFAVTAPEGIHVNLLCDKIEFRLENTRLLREMLMPGRGAFKHRPFTAHWRNGTRIVSRLPQRDGKGMKGLHCVELHIDEGQDFPEPAWNEIRETVKRDVEGHQWRVHGVTRGIPDEFDKISRPGSGWKVHRYTQLHKPTWTPEEKQQKVDEYGGSVEAPEYKRNVMGVASDSDNAVFFVPSLMRCTDVEETSLYNTEEFIEQYITWEQVEEHGRKIGASEDEYPDVLASMLDLRALHTERYKVFWGGMDVGITVDPSAVMMFAEYQPSTEEKRRDKAMQMAVPLDGASRLKLLARFEMRRTPVPAQVRAVMAIIDHYRPTAFGVDKTGNGMGILQGLQQAALESRLMRVEINDDDGIPPEVESARRSLTVIKGYNFGGKTLIGFDEQIASTLDPSLSIEDVIKQAGLFKQAKEYATDVARLYVDAQRLYLPYDDGAKVGSNRSLIRQMTGQTWTYNKSLTDAYGNRQRIFSAGQFHAFDGLRMAMIAHNLHPLEQMVENLRKPKTREARPVFFL